MKPRKAIRQNLETWIKTKWPYDPSYKPVECYLSYYGKIKVYVFRQCREEVYSYVVAAGANHGLSHIGMTRAKNKEKAFDHIRDFFRRYREEL
jgi:hypothetical protein